MTVEAVRKELICNLVLGDYMEFVCMEMISFALGLPLFLWFL